MIFALFGPTFARSDTAEQQNALILAQANLATAQAKTDADSGGPTSTDQQSAQFSVDQAQQQLDAATKSRSDTANQNDIKISQSARSRPFRRRRSRSNWPTAPTSRCLSIPRRPNQATAGAPANVTVGSTVDVQPGTANFALGTSPDPNTTPGLGGFGAVNFGPATDVTVVAAGSTTP